jgi:hypothetical protein
MIKSVEDVKSVKDVKSVHIEGCWPYQYVAPNRRKHTEDAKKRQNELRRARYAKAKSLKTPKKEGSKRLLGLQVFELDIDFCNELNQRSEND